MLRVSLVLSLLFIFGSCKKINSEVIKSYLEDEQFIEDELTKDQVVDGDGDKGNGNGEGNPEGNPSGQETSNQAPTNIFLSNDSILENYTEGTVIATLSCADPEGDACSFAFHSDPDSKFAIFTNQLLVKTGASFDYDTATSHNLSLVAIDTKGAQSDPIDFTITVNEVVVSHSNIVTDQILGWFDYTSTSGSNSWSDRAYSEGYTPEALNATFIENATISTIDGINAAYLDGSTGTTIAINNSNSFTWSGIKASGSGFSVDIWFRSNGAWLNNGGIWSALFNSGMRTRMENGKFVYPYIRGGQVFSPSSQALATDTWYHIVTTYNDATDTISTYFNGQLVDSRMSAWNPEPWIGSRTAIGCQWDYSIKCTEEQRMYVGSFRMYKKPLSAAEVSQNYNEEKTTFGH